MSGFNSGYNGYSMSVRATEAYNSGEKPISKWTKDEIISTIRYDEDIRACIEEEAGKTINFEKLNALPLYALKACLYCTSWHHTGNCFKKTDSYSIDEDRVANLIKANYKYSANESAKDKDDYEPGYCHGRYKEFSGFHPYSKIKKFAVKWVDFENARVKGEWLYLEDGHRKKLTNVDIVKRTKTKRRKKH